MALFEQLRENLVAARKAGRTTEIEILRVAVGELQTLEARGESIDDEVTTKVIRKLSKSNRETYALTEPPEQKAELDRELAVLEALLPKSLGVDEIVAALAPVVEAIKAAKSDGQATGIAMKHLKHIEAAAEGKTVGEAVRKLRG